MHIRTDHGSGIGREAPYRPVASVRGTMIAPSSRRQGSVRPQARTRTCSSSRCVATSCQEARRSLTIVSDTCHIVPGVPATAHHVELLFTYQFGIPGFATPTSEHGSSQWRIPVSPVSAISSP